MSKHYNIRISEEHLNSLYDVLEHLKEAEVKDYKFMSDIINLEEALPKRNEDER